VFVQRKVPFGAFTASSAVRQIDVGTKAQVLSDLLGHRDHESVSAYVRIATQSLREISLPVPR
jgi:site-specific recombinase XerD